MFDFSKVSNFDQHIELSIPNYGGMIDLFFALGLEFMQPSGVCVDIGCSTGAFISKLSKGVEGTYIGIDKTDFSERHSGFEFLQKDINDGETRR